MRSFFLVSALALLCLAAGCGSGPTSPTPAPTPTVPTADITSVHHIIIMLQQNHTFDNYFGQMTGYRQRNSIPIVSSDGKINDLSSGTFTNSVAGIGPVTTAHTGSVCIEDLSSDWAESHKEMNISNPAAAGPSAPMNGFAQTAYDVSVYQVSQGAPAFSDQTGRRAMRYFDDSDLNYYYFLGSNFAIGDAFFTSIPSRFLNRLFVYAGTTQGRVHDPNGQLTAKTIFQALDEHNISWKIYIPDTPAVTYLQYFTYYNLANTKTHFYPLTQYFTDLSNGTLPSVAIIEPALFTGRDEHPSNWDPSSQTIFLTNMQTGANFVSQIVNALMTSSSWKDSVFFFSYDEGGGYFDHVPPITVVNPDGIKPVDTIAGDPAGADLTISGFRVPNIVISPFARKNFVSHTPMDQTAYLRFIETRFGLPTLTARDASMPDMTEFFDFTAAPWATPPTPPAQNMTGACNFALQ